ncbi:hypothetical protein H8356DRAFT_1719903 [Neocallimastix lanati (nom. inval.)]|jgi:hypothetical protein|nr:hypothetical protein H8356DRAFT_1719903 [Neocallimastix sp. JGI-2020a]
MSSTTIQIMAINNELKRKPVGLLGNMNTKQVRLDLAGLKARNNTNTTFENYIPSYTQYENTQEKLANSKISDLFNQQILDSTNGTHFVTEAPEPVEVDYCETCNHVLQHCKGCLDHTKLCGNPHCGNRQKGTTFCIACKGLDEFHPICRNCVEYPPYSAPTNQCGHCKGYFCSAALSNPSLKYTCSKCDSMVCWRCRTMCNHNTLNTNNENDTITSKASVNIDILMK